MKHLDRLRFVGSGEISFQEFCSLASQFMEEDTDMEAMQQELREAFRLYDREGNGYITTDVFRDILHELDDALSPEELDMIIDEVDADGSGTVDFEGTYNVLELRLSKLLSKLLYSMSSTSSKRIEFQKYIRH